MKKTKRAPRKAKRKPSGTSTRDAVRLIASILLVQFPSHLLPEERDQLKVIAK